MPEIKVLSPHVADLIAAGEVVERPASAAKELIENAIDAGASKVTVEIEHGGMTFLRVSDDGRGIPPGELKTAFLRHATSKLRSEYDLEAIGTLGFRGEALAAIAAVSRVDIMSRTPDAQLGAALSLEGGAAGEAEESGCAFGTTVVVRDLFYNTPARLKFLKKDAAEGAAVFAAVQREALSHPEISVKFIRDGRQELLTPGDGRLKTAVYAVLGRELALGLIPVQSAWEDMAVSGFASLPACCRGSRGAQFFFVNGRFVKSRLMMAALEEAYRNQKMVGKFPACVLHLTLGLGGVDVNVHPAKTEVKFGSEKKVFDAVYHAVLSALEGDNTHPAAAVERPKAWDTGTPSRTAVGAMTAQRYRAGSLTLRDAGRARADWSAVFQRAPAPGAGPEAAPVPEPEPVPEAAPVPGPEPVPEAAPVLGPEPVPEPESIPEPGAAPWRVAGEVFRTYILVEQGDRVLLIDKHAAHERLNFDRMRAEGYEPMVQALLSPVTVRGSAEENEILLRHLPLLERFGFAAEEFGGGAILVRQAPDGVDPEEVENTLLELADRLLTTGGADPTAARDEVLHTMACKAAVKGGWNTSVRELERLAEAVVSGQVKYCPHGRPVAVELTKKQLEKQLGRRNTTAGSNA